MSVVSLPHEEINELWFGGLEFDPEKPFPMEGVQRWFRQTDEFDHKCLSVSLHLLLILGHTRKLSVRLQSCLPLLFWHSLRPLKSR